jgi:hypothetical protein
MLEITQALKQLREVRQQHIHAIEMERQYAREVLEGVRPPSVKEELNHGNKIAALGSILEVTVDDVLRAFDSVVSDPEAVRGANE